MKFSVRQSDYFPVFFYPKILHNLADGTAEDGRSLKLSDEDRAESVKLWQERELRVLYSLCNSAIMHKVDSVIGDCL